MRKLKRRISKNVKSWNFARNLVPYNIGRVTSGVIKSIIAFFLTPWLMTNEISTDQIGKIIDTPLKSIYGVARQYPTKCFYSIYPDEFMPLWIIKTSQKMVAKMHVSRIQSTDMYRFIRKGVSSEKWTACHLHLSPVTVINGDDGKIKVRPVDLRPFWVFFDPKIQYFVFCLVRNHFK